MTALFVCDHLQIKAPLKFIIDTGSVHTTLPEHTAKELGIDLTDLSRKIQIKSSGIGGSCTTHYLGGVSLIFRAVDGTEVGEEIHGVHILENPPPRSEQERKTFDTIPNLLGLDVIRRYGLRFDKNAVWLERE